MLMLQPTAKLLVKLTKKFHAIGGCSPPNTLLKQEGLQLADTGFRE